MRVGWAEAVVCALATVKAPLWARPPHRPSIALPRFLGVLGSMQTTMHPGALVAQIALVRLRILLSSMGKPLWMSLPLVAVRLLARGAAQMEASPRRSVRWRVPTFHSIPWVTITMMQTLFCLRRRGNRHGAHMLLAAVPWATLTMHLRRLAACSPTAEGCVKLALWLGQHQELESARRTGGIIAGTTVAQALQ